MSKPSHTRASLQKSPKAWDFPLVGKWDENVTLPDVGSHVTTWHSKKHCLQGDSFSSF